MGGCGRATVHGAYGLRGFLAGNILAWILLYFVRNVYSLNKVGAQSVIRHSFLVDGRYNSRQVVYNGLVEVSR